MRKGIRPIKCVGCVRRARRDMPKRRGGGEGGRGGNGVRRETRRAMEGDERGLGPGQKDEEGKVQAGRRRRRRKRQGTRV